jgi:hypothetical protein
LSFVLGGVSALLEVAWVRTRLYSLDWAASLQSGLAPLGRRSSVAGFGAGVGDLRSNSFPLILTLLHKEVFPVLRFRSPYILLGCLTCLAFAHSGPGRSRVGFTL